MGRALACAAFIAKPPDDTRLATKDGWHEIGYLFEPRRFPFLQEAIQIGAAVANASATKFDGSQVVSLRKVPERQRSGSRP